MTTSEPLTPKLLRRLASPVRATRLQAVEDLARLAADRDAGSARAARAALTGLLDDDSRQVSAAAAAALDRIPALVDPVVVPSSSRAAVPAIRKAIAAARRLPVAAGERLPTNRRRAVTVLVGAVAVLVLLVGLGLAARTGAARFAAPGPVARSAGPVAPGLVSTGRPAVIGTIPVGREPEGVAVSPDGRTVYVANQGSHVLSVLDAATRRITPVPLRSTPRFIAVSPDGRRVFVAVYEPDNSGSAVAVLDAATHRVLRYLATGRQPYDLAVSPDGRLWVPIHSSRRVEVYSAGDQRPVGRVLVPQNPHSVAFAAGAGRAFTPDHESNSVSVIDLRTVRLLRSVPVSRAPHSLAVSPDGRTVLVAGYEAGAVDLIDTTTLRRTGPFPVGRSPQSVAFSADGRHAYVVNEGDDSVTVLDSRTGAVTATVVIGRSPRTIAVAPDGRVAYVTNGADDTVTVLRMAN